MSELLLGADAVRPTVSASRLKVIGGEKGAPGCERRYLGNYLFGMKQSETEALRRGSALHAAAEHYQLTGAIAEPESEIGTLLASGAHLINMCGRLLVEHEHVGELPDGTPFVAYLDGHSEHALHGTGTIIIQDLKTSGAPAWALRGEDQATLDATNMTPEDRALVGCRPGAAPPSPYALRRDIQAMMYAWILLCYKHQFRSGPDAPWQTWDPLERGARVARLRWLYFLTKGSPRAWEETDFILPQQAAAFMASDILPLTLKINNIHRWHHSTPGVTLDKIDRTPAACGNKGRWCGVYERGGCNFEELGTPINDLIQLKVRTQMTPAERLAQIKADIEAKKNGGTPPAAPAAAAAPPPAPVQEATTASPPPAAEPPAETTEQPSASAPVSSAVDSSGATPSDAPSVPGELSRGQKAAATRKARAAAGQTPASPPGAGINPPEVVDALAKLAAVAAADPAPAPAATPVTVPVAVVTLVGIEQITAFLISQGYAVSAGGAQ